MISVSIQFHHWLHHNRWWSFFIFSDLEEDFTTYSRDVQRRSSDADAAGMVYDRCPICHTTELVPDPQPGSANEGLACTDCDRLVCLQCGFYTPGIATDVSLFIDLFPPVLIPFIFLAYILVSSCAFLDHITWLSCDIHVIGRLLVLQQLPLLN